MVDANEAFLATQTALLPLNILPPNTSLPLAVYFRSRNPPGRQASSTDFDRHPFTARRLALPARIREQYTCTGQCRGAFRTGQRGGAPARRIKRRDPGLGRGGGLR
ncbi:MAG: hypothetical protein MZV64_19760 [Ignavibacteriales bacterium]|nr:hypothetical protein [Ignavibacteriales bacterium]